MKQKSGFTNSAKYKCLEDLQKDSVELSLIYCGSEDCSPGFRFGPNRRNTYLIHVVCEGKGTLEIRDKVYHLKKGDAFLIPPEETAWYEADEEEPWSYIWVGFIGIRAEECLGESGFNEMNFAVSTTCSDDLHRIVVDMLEAHELSFEDELKRNALLLEFFSIMIKDYKKNNPDYINKNNKSNYAYVKKAMEYIFCNYSQKIRIEDLAEYIGINRSYLTSSFKQNLGCSPQEYLIKFRMEKAKSLLKKTTMPVGSVANAVGYSDSLAFSKIFKQYFGVSPKSYREQEQELVILEKKNQKYDD